MFRLEDLEAIIAERAQEDAAVSYTASLLAKGKAKCAQKLGEEAVELVIAAMDGDRREITNETADLLFHLLVVLKENDIPLAEIMQELQSRTSKSGHEEKASRKSN